MPVPVADTFSTGLVSAVEQLDKPHAFLDQTSGEEATYTAYWARLMGRLGRPAPLPYLLPPADDTWSRPHRRSRLCAMAGDTEVTFEVSPLRGEATLELESASISDAHDDGKQDIPPKTATVQVLYL